MRRRFEVVPSDEWQGAERLRSVDSASGCCSAFGVVRGLLLLLLLPEVSSDLGLGEEGPVAVDETEGSAEASYELTKGNVSCALLFSERQQRTWLGLSRINSKPSAAERRFLRTAQRLDRVSDPEVRT